MSMALGPRTAAVVVAGTVEVQDHMLEMRWSGFGGMVLAPGSMILWFGL